MNGTCSEQRPPDQPRLGFHLAFIVVAIAAVGAMVYLGLARNSDAGSRTAIAALPTSCAAPNVEGGRLLVEFTLRGSLINIVCRPLPPLVARPTRAGKS